MRMCKCRRRYMRVHLHLHRHMRLHGQGTGMGVEGRRATQWGKKCTCMYMGGCEHVCLHMHKSMSMRRHMSMCLCVRTHEVCRGVDGGVRVRACLRIRARVRQRLHAAGRVGVSKGKGGRRGVRV